MKFNEPIDSSRCITRRRVNRNTKRLNEENVKVLTHTRSTADIAVNKIEQSFQSVLDFYYSRKLRSPPAPSLANFGNLFGKAGRERARGRVPRAETRREKVILASFSAVVRNDPSRAALSAMPRGCGRKKSALSTRCKQPAALSVSFDKPRALGGFGVGFHTAQRPNYP